MTDRQPRMRLDRRAVRWMRDQQPPLCWLKAGHSNAAVQTSASLLPTEGRSARSRTSVDPLRIEWMLKSEQRQSILAATFWIFRLRRHAGFGSCFSRSGGLRGSGVRSVFNCCGQLSGRGQSLSFQTQSNQKFQQQVGLIILKADRAAHLQRLLLQPNSGHGNKNDKKQPCGKPKEHD